MSKKKKNKIKYIDDGSSVADMSATAGRKRADGKGEAPKPKSTFKDKARTYFSTVKKMVVPMLVTLLAFSLVYLILLLATGRLF